MFRHPTNRNRNSHHGPGSVILPLVPLGGRPQAQRMIARFCTYAVLRNLRVFDPFLVLFLLHDVGLDYVAVGALLAWQKLLSGLLEVPLGVATDRWGRRRALIISFSLAALAFVGFALAPSRGALTVPLLYAAQSIYAVAEAARSGSHKAIILDWLTRQGRRAEKTAVIGRTRFFSKTSGGAAALIGGLIVWQTGRFAPLFWAALLPTLAAVGLMLSYPRALDAPDPAAQAAERPGLWRGLAAAARRPGLLGMLLISVAFESQIKLALVYLQPFLADALGAVSLDVAAGIGAVIYGAWFFVQGLAAGLASLLSARLAGDDPARALRRIHQAAALALALIGLLGWLAGGLALVVLPVFLALAALQNARRPIFVAALDDVMDPRFRTTALSVETQARSWSYALGALLAGALADWQGPGLALLGMGIILGGAVALSRR